MLHLAADFLRDAEHILEVGAAVLAHRRADGDEDEFALVERFLNLRRELERPLFDIRAHEV